VGGEAGGGDEKKSSVVFDVLGGAAVDFVEPMVDPIRSKLLPDGMDWVLDCWVLGSGLEGIESKNPPPLTAGDGEKGFEAAGGDMELPSESKADTDDCFGAEGVTVEGKVRPLNASVRPPKASFCCLACGGACIADKEPNEGFRSCCAGACVFGAEAYSDKMDCLRSGLDGPVEEGLETALEGLFIGAD
jgi:hypothetical protein